MTIEDIKRAVTSEWLKLILLLVAVIGGWYRFDFRISAMEKLAAEHDQQFQKLSPVIDKLDKTLDRIDQTMRDFPLHRHVDDEGVLYPGDAVIRDGRGSGKR